MCYISAAMLIFQSKTWRSFVLTRVFFESAMVQKESLLIMFDIFGCLL